MKLYWVNAGQYYTKTGTLFRDYTFVAGNTRVVFRITEPRRNWVLIKPQRSVFVLDSVDPTESVSFEAGGDKEDVTNPAV